jgi:hypothetical protein
MVGGGSKDAHFDNQVLEGVDYYKSQSMSSLAAARADGYYRPKNFDPAKIIPRKSDLA